MKPDKSGIWEWYDTNGIKRLVSVFNIEHDPSRPQYLRVYFWGGYYNVNDEPEEVPGDPFCKAEWPDRWGNYIGPEGCVKEEDLYGMPTKEELEIIAKNQKKH